MAVVACWRDARAAPRERSLPAGAGQLVDDLTFSDKAQVARLRIGQGATVVVKRPADSAALGRELQALRVLPEAVRPGLVAAGDDLLILEDLGPGPSLAAPDSWFKAQTEPLGAVSSYNPVAPVRALDIRDGTGAGGVSGPMGPGGVVVLQVAGTNGIPADGVTAVVLNVTVTNPTGPDSFLTVYPAPGPRPLASNLNFRANQTVANLVVPCLSG